MKKLFTHLLVVFSLAFILASCTEVEVKPASSDSVANGGSVSKSRI